MKKFSNFLKSPVAFPLFAVGGIYLFWFFTGPMDIILGDDNFSNYFGGLILFGIYIFLAFIAIKITKYSKWALLYFLISMYLNLYAIQFITYSISLTIDYGQENSIMIFLAAIAIISFYPFYPLITRLKSKNKILSILIYISTLPVFGANIAYPLIFYPQTIEEIDAGEYKYYITSSIDWDIHGYENFYKCDGVRFFCQRLYISSVYSLGPITVDEQNSEVSLLGMRGSVILYTDGNNPRSYTTPNTQFENKIYQFSQECNNFNKNKGYYACESYTYILYECRPDFKSCKPLPLKYTKNEFDTLLIIEANEITKDLNIYDDYPEYGGGLLFTYGDNPRCYVEGCEILKP